MLAFPAQSVVPMNHSEIILLGSLVVVAAGAFLLENASVDTIRPIAIGIVILLNVGFVYGGIRRILKRNAEAKAIREAMAQAEALEREAAEGGGERS